MKFAHKITPEAYRSRAIIARSGDPSLGWIATDLAAPNDDKSLRTSSFYTGGPGPVGNLHDRLMACRSAVTDVGLAVQRTLAGTSRRVEKFGLGFDYRRITPPTDPNRGNWVDPIVEAVAFFGLAFFPVRGTGEVFHKSSRAVTRGWTSGTTRVGGFRWTTWKSPLDAAAIDAMLDRFWSAEKDLVSPLEGATFESVPYKQLSTADPTRGYGSRRVQHGR